MGIKKRFGSFSTPTVTDRNGNFRYTPNPVASGTLGDLGDVLLTNSQLGDFLWYNGTKWVNENEPTVDTKDRTLLLTRTSDSAGEAFENETTLRLNNRITDTNSYINDEGGPAIQFNRSSGGVFTKNWVSGGAIGAFTVTLNNSTDLAIGHKITGTGLPEGYGALITNIAGPVITLNTAFTQQAAGSYTTGTPIAFGSVAIEWFGTTNDHRFRVAASTDNFLENPPNVYAGTDILIESTRKYTEINEGVLYVDAVNNRVGINKTDPAYALDVTGEIRLSGENLYMNQDDTAADVSVRFNTGRTLKWSHTNQRFELNANTYISDDLTVDGGNINLNGAATAGVMPFLTFATQADGNNSLYGIRGMSTVDDPWFVGAGSVGDDGGYLEIATGDNTNGTNTGGEIYVRQYNGQGAGGAPWYGGSGTIQTELILLSNFGYTSIPKRLGINNTSPLYELDVNGVGNIETRLTVPEITTLVGDDLAISAYSTGTAGSGKNITITATNAPDGGGVIIGHTNSFDPVTILRNTATTSTAVRALTLRANSTGTPAIGFGAQIEFEVETASGVIKSGGFTDVVATNVSSGDETFKMRFGVMNDNTTAASLMELDSLGNLQIDGTLEIDGNQIKNSAGTTVLTFSGTNLVTTAGDIAIGGNTIRDSANTAAIELSGANVTVEGTLEVNGNQILSSTGATALTLSAADVAVAGDLTVTGNDIKSSSATALTLSGADVTVAGDLTVTGDDIKKSGGTTVLTFSGTNLITTAGDITIGGNTIRDSANTAAIELSGANVEVVGDLTVTGNDIKSSSATALTLSGANVTVAGDLTVTGNDIKSSTATAITLSGDDVTVVGDLTVGNRVARGTVVQYTKDYTATLSTANQVIDSWSTATYRNAKYTIQVAFIYDAVGPKYYYKSIDISVIAKHDDSAAFMIESNELDTVGFDLSTFSVAMSGSTLQLRASPFSTSFIGAEYRIDATLMQSI
jgi:hypothetical protein